MKIVISKHVYISVAKQRLAWRYIIFNMFYIYYRIACPIIISQIDGQCAILVKFGKTIPLPFPILKLGFESFSPNFSI